MTVLKIISFIIINLSVSGAYFFNYFISTSLFACEFNDKYYFSLKTYLIYSQIIGYFVGKILCAFFLSGIDKKKRFFIFLSVYSANIICYLPFYLGGLYVKMFSVFTSGILLSSIWGFIMFYIEGRYGIEIIMISLNFFTILGNGASRSFASILLEGKIQEGWIPLICSVVGCVGGCACVYMLKFICELDPLEEERREVTITDQTTYLKKYFLGILGISFMYGLMTSFKKFRDYFGLEIWKSIYGNNFPSHLYFSSEAFSAIAVTIAFATIFAFKDARKSFYYMLIMFLVMSIFILITTVSYILFPNYGYLWIILTNIPMYSIYLPLGSLIYDKLMSYTGGKITSVFVFYIADIFGSLFTIITVLLKDLVMDTEKILFFLKIFSIVTGIIMTILSVLTIAYFLISERIFRKKITVEMNE